MRGMDVCLARRTQGWRTGVAVGCAMQSPGQGCAHHFPSAPTRTLPTPKQRALRSLTLEHQALKSAAAAGAATESPVTGPVPEPAASPPGHHQSRVAYPLRPIGQLHSCFSGRNGTPRQPLLVKTARAELELRPELSPDFFQGLEQFSHCWVLYIFHENTGARSGPGERERV